MQWLCCSVKIKIHCNRNDVNLMKFSSLHGCTRICHFDNFPIAASNEKKIIKMTTSSATSDEKWHRFHFGVWFGFPFTKIRLSYHYDGNPSPGMTMKRGLAEILEDIWQASISSFCDSDSIVSSRSGGWSTVTGSLISPETRLFLASIKGTSKLSIIIICSLCG